MSKMIDLLPPQNVEFFSGGRYQKVERVTRLEVKDGILFLWQRDAEGETERFARLIRDWTDLEVRFQS